MVDSESNMDIYKSVKYWNSNKKSRNAKILPSSP